MLLKTHRPKLMPNGSKLVECGPSSGQQWVRS